MNIPTIEMEPDVAREHYLAYRHAALKNWYKEDVFLKRMYLQMSKGRRIVNLRDAIAAGGWHENGLPKLAIARADEQWIHCQRLRSEVHFLPPGRFRVEANRRWRFPAPIQTEQDWSFRWHRSVVPIIPPALRPADGLHLYHILWEADWKEVPADPALLKHLGGDMYAVVAVWDLTDLERLALGMRQEPQ